MVFHSIVVVWPVSVVASVVGSRVVVRVGGTIVELRVCLGLRSCKGNGGANGHQDNLNSNKNNQSNNLKNIYTKCFGVFISFAV